MFQKCDTAATGNELCIRQLCLASRIDESHQYFFPHRRSHQSIVQKLAQNIIGNANLFTCCRPPPCLPGEEDQWMPMRGNNMQFG